MAYYEQGWDSEEEVPQKQENVRNFFIPVDDNTPDEEKEVQVVFLDESPFKVSRHHFSDPRLFDTKNGRMGKWGNFHTCVASDTEYDYCPACRIERKFGKDVKSSRQTYYYLTVFSKRQYVNQKGETKESGKALFQMNADNFKAIKRIVKKMKEKNPEFSLAGSLFSCFRTSSKVKEGIGNQFEFESEYGLKKIREEAGEYGLPYDYKSVFAPAKIEEMEDDYNHVCGTDFFTTSNPVHKAPIKTEKPAGRQPRKFETDDLIESEEIPF